MKEIDKLKFDEEHDCMDWLNILIFGVIPVFAVVIMFLVERKMLWVTPIISMVLTFIAYTIAVESTMAEIFSNNEWRGLFLLAILMIYGAII